MARRVGIGVIGCGGAARIGHLKWYASNPNARLVAVADVDEAKAKSCRNEFGAQYHFTDYRDLLKLDEVEGVSICTPPWLHKEQTVTAAEQGKNVLCEKPMARSLGECDEMIRACRRNGVKLMMGFMKRFNAGFQLVKENLAPEKLGNPFYMDVHWEMYVEPLVKEWRLWDERVGGGVFQDHGCHYIDLFRWWTGDEVEMVSAETLKLVADRKFEDHAVAVLKFRKGALGIIETSKDTLVPGLQEYGWIHAEKGSVSFDSPPWNSFELPRLRISLKNGDALTQVNFELRPDTLRYSTYMFKREIDHFVDCILRDFNPIVTGADGRAVIEVVLAAYRSYEEARKIRLPLAT